MNPWIWRIIILIIAIPLIPLLVNGVADLVVSAVQAIGTGIHKLLSPLSMSGTAGLKGVIKLCLYLVAITLLARFMFNRRS